MRTHSAWWIHDLYGRSPSSKSRALRGILILCVGWMLSGCGACSPSSTGQDTPTRSATANGPPADERAAVPSASAPRTLQVHTLDELKSIDLSNLTALDLALSPIDRMGSEAATAEDVCTSLNLAALAERIPKLQRLRISGCQSAVAANLGAFANTVTDLAVADMQLDADVIAQLRQWKRLPRLALTRVEATEASLTPLRSLGVQQLHLRELERDSPLSALVELWPRSLTHATYTGRWAGHEAMVRLAGSAFLRHLGLHETRVGNYSLNQIKSLQRLRSVDWSGETFNDNSPLYVRDLPVQTFRCACPRFGDGGLRTLRHNEALQKVVLPESRITGAGLVHLQQLEQLREFVALGRDVGPEGFRALSAVPGLQRLVLGETWLEHTELPALGELKQLRALKLSYRNLGDRTASHLAELDNLRSLDLGHTDISDASLSAIGQLSGLRELRLHHTRITNRGLAHLAKLRQLRVLELDHTDVVDTGVARLSDLPQLRELRLDATLVTDEAMDTLLQFRRLERINLAETVVSTEGAARLASLPRLQTVHLGPPTARKPWE